MDKLLRLFLWTRHAGPPRSSGGTLQLAGAGRNGPHRCAVPPSLCPPRSGLLSTTLLRRQGSVRGHRHFRVRAVLPWGILLRPGVYWPQRHYVSSTRADGVWCQTGCGRDGGAGGARLRIAFCAWCFALCPLGTRRSHGVELAGPSPPAAWSTRILEVGGACSMVSHNCIYHQTSCSFR